MAKSSPGSSLLQARSNAHSHAHSLFHRIRDSLSHDVDETLPVANNDNTDIPSHSRSQNSNHHRHHHANQRDDKGTGFETELGAAIDLETPSGAASAAHVEVRELGGGITEKIVVNALQDNGLDPYVTHVVQTVSLFQYVDSKGSAYMTSTMYAVPNTVVMDPSGKTISQSSPKHQTQAALGFPSSAQTSGTASAGDTSRASAQTGITASSRDSAVSQSSAPTAASHVSSVSIRPSAGVVRNGTQSVAHGNSTVVPSSNSTSLYKPLLFSIPTSLSATSTSADFLSTSSSSRSSHHSTTSYASYTTTTPSNAYGSPTASAPQPSETSGGDASPGVNLSPQQKQVIGGVVGGVAGIAVLGLLLLMFLRYKRRKGEPTIMDAQAGPSDTRALGDGSSGGDGSGSGSGAAMADRSSTSAAVAAAFASLTGKGNAKLPSSHSASNERGFYRVSGRKLPSVLNNGGDGYTDPRGSGASGQSDYFRGSQAFEPAKPGGLALGEPMRPVSGVPIMRSGPAKVAIKENPFADPGPSTPPATGSSPGRTLGSRDSPRASGSRFQEKI